MSTTESAERKPTKLDQKKQQIWQDRMRRHMAKGMSEEDARALIRKEDYDALPLEKKFQRLEAVCMGAVDGLANDLRSLLYNDGVISDAMDANLKAITKAFEKLGITKEEQAALLKEAEVEVKAEREARIRAREAEILMAQEKAKVGTLQEGADKPGVPDAPPADATVFGGDDAA